MESVTGVNTLSKWEIEWKLTTSSPNHLEGQIGTATYSFYTNTAMTQKQPKMWCATLQSAQEPYEGKLSCTDLKQRMRWRQIIRLQPSCQIYRAAHLQGGNGRDTGDSHGREVHQPCQFP